MEPKVWQLIWLWEEFPQLEQMRGKALADQAWLICEILRLWPVSASMTLCDSAFSASPLPTFSFVLGDGYTTSGEIEVGAVWIRSDAA